MRDKLIFIRKTRNLSYNQPLNKWIQELKGIFNLNITKEELAPVLEGLYYDERVEFEQLKYDEYVDREYQELCGSAGPDGNYQRSVSASTAFIH